MCFDCGAAAPDGPGGSYMRYPNDITPPIKRNSGCGGSVVVSFESASYWDPSHLDYGCTWCWCSSFRHWCSSVLLYLGYAIDRHDTHLYHKRITRTVTLKCTLKYYEILNSRFALENRYSCWLSSSGDRTGYLCKFQEASRVQHG